MTRLLLLLLLLPQIFSHTPEAEGPRNIILMIGDGMGLTQISAGRYSGQDNMNILQFPVSGLQKTHSYKNLITDSAAGATAMACGCKTTNGSIGLDAKKHVCPSILEAAKAMGMSTGIAVTCSITHATPAAFVAHVDARNKMEAIATFFLQTQVDFFLGGGQKYFTERKDGRNLQTEMEALGYQFETYDPQHFGAKMPNPAAPWACFTAFEEPLSAKEGRNYLPKGVEMALQYLPQRSNKGFFLMVEGAQIDWACHQNDAEAELLELADFDAAVGKALEFARKDGNTLVIVTADHETGGMALAQTRARNTVEIEFNTKSHTATMVPVFAYGPGANAFGGIYDNTALHQKMQDFLENR